MAEEPETALARGAALAAANAPLFASSTAALAYAQDPGTGAVDQYSLPDYLYVPVDPEPTSNSPPGRDSSFSSPATIALSRPAASP
ncbi:hypothetical protein MAHJHV50_50790 [Mycobacterium avium subsp. hominissuis]